MEWVVYFILNLIIFLLLVDWSELQKNIWGGLLAIVFACVVDSHKVNENVYLLKDLIIEIHNTSIFFLLGPSFVIGTLVPQYYPMKKLWMIANIFVLVALFTLMEYTLVERGVIEYINWHYYDSIIINFAAIIAISWFSIAVIGKKIYQ